MAQGLKVGRDQSGRPLPTGGCWCDCGVAVQKQGSFFVQGHEQRAVMHIARSSYKDSVVEFMLEHGYGPGGRSVFQEIEKARRQSGR